VGRRQRVSVYGNSERDVLDQLTKLRDQLRRGVPVATTTLSVAEYMSYWLGHIAALDATEEQRELVRRQNGERETRC
jgi:hypothetical protein